LKTELFSLLAESLLHALVILDLLLGEDGLVIGLSGGKHVEAAALGLVIALVVISFMRDLLHLPHQPASFYTTPFYDRSTFSSSALFRGTSIAVLTYIGFDGISTLADEAKNPERSIPRAIVATCLITGVLASIEVYLGQLVWPRGAAFPDMVIFAQRLEKVKLAGSVALVVSAILVSLSRLPLALNVWVADGPSCKRTY
jgi:amino acid transporter